MSEAMGQLGTTYDAMARLIVTGVIRKSATGDRQRLINVYRTDVQKVAELMLPRCPAPEGGHTLCVVDIVRALAGYRVSAGDLVAATLIGVISVYGKKKNKLFDVELSCIEVVSWLRRSQQISEKALMRIKWRLGLRSESCKHHSEEIMSQTIDAPLSTIDIKPCRSSDLATHKIAAE